MASFIHSFDHIYLSHMPQYNHFNLLGSDDEIFCASSRSIFISLFVRSGCLFMTKIIDRRVTRYRTRGRCVTCFGLTQTSESAGEFPHVAQGPGCTRSPKLEHAHWYGYFGPGTPQSLKIGRFSKIIWPPPIPIRILSNPPPLSFPDVKQFQRIFFRSGRMTPKKTMKRGNGRNE